MKCDYHVHTYYSEDSVYNMEDVVKDAINLGINELCFTDHVDYGICLDHHEMSESKKQEIILNKQRLNLNVDYPAYVKEINMLKEKYPEISLKLGLEFGIQKHTIVKYQKLFHSYNFDFILLSCHEIDNKEFWNQEYQKDLTQKEFHHSYYQTILNIIKEYKDYSVLAHLDLVNRYDLKGNYAFENVKEIITEILKQVIKDGKGIEVNTSNKRYGLKDLTPSKDILKLYKELGGTILTIGSDSHKKEHLYENIEETKLELKKLGFKYYCTFDKMIPVYHKL